MNLREVLYKKSKMTQLIVKSTEDYMKERLAGDSTGHDWWHTYRVQKLGRYIASKENANLYVVELACLLHDIADFKLHRGDEEIGPRLAGEWLESLLVDKFIIGHVKDIVTATSFKGVNSENKIRTLEGMCVQDADRLDAIGAIGIARTFAFGGARGNVIYDPTIPVDINQSEEEYKKADHPQINHFYEKLLWLRDRMNTRTGKELAQERHKFMVRFLMQFFKEWSLES